MANSQAHSPLALQARQQTHRKEEPLQQKHFLLDQHMSRPTKTTILLPKTYNNRHTSEGYDFKQACSTEVIDPQK